MSARLLRIPPRLVRGGARCCWHSRLRPTSALICATATHTALESRAVSRTDSPSAYYTIQGAVGYQARGLTVVHDTNLRCAVCDTGISPYAMLTRPANRGATVCNLPGVACGG